MNIIIPVNRKRFPIVLVVSLIGTIVVAILIRYLVDHNYLPYGWMNWLFVGGPLYYFLVSLAEYVKTLFDKNAGLRITDEGIDDNLSIFSCGKVPWSEIEGIAVHRAMKTRFLAIRVKDAAGLVARQAAWKKHVLNKFIRRWGSPIIVSEKRVTTDLEQLLHTLVEQGGGTLSEGPSSGAAPGASSGE